ncbi:MAG: helix-turn-helix transcriptional regulator, partial [Clostridia bacterium]|nr:helix-turn-helix transcriptional regulator [Clostridia bacterium]
MLNENLKRLRTEKGFTQETLAAELHVVRQTVSKWEKGLSVPDAEMLVRIAETLDVSRSFQYFHDLHIGRKPGNRTNLTHFQPLCIFVLEQRQTAVFDP